MPTNVRHHSHVCGASSIGWQSAPMGGFVNIGPALLCSPVTRLFGRPYPLQFRAQGRLDAWTRAPGKAGLWFCWKDFGTICWETRQEILRQLQCIILSLQ